MNAPMPVRGRTLGLVSADPKGEVSIVNVFASWWGIDREGRELGRHAGPAQWDDPEALRVISRHLAR